MKYLIALLIFLIQTDGTISDGEWKGADKFDLGDSSSVLMKHEGDALYVALNSTKPFWAHFYLSDGKRVKVMHASAALGSINYNEAGSLWRTDDKSFVYELRDREHNERNMNAYYSAHGWVANNNSMGDKKTIEAKLDLSGFDAKYFACVIATAEKFHSYPRDLKDDTVLTKLVQGYAVDSLKFEPMTWSKIH